MTKADFARFKKECEKWLDKLCLRSYNVDYEQADLGSLDAQVEYSAMTKVATISVHEDLPPDRIPSAAKHECIHLLLASLSHLARSRYITEEWLEEAEEGVVVLLEHLL